MLIRDNRKALVTVFVPGAAPGEDRIGLEPGWVTDVPDEVLENEGNKNLLLGRYLEVMDELHGSRVQVLNTRASKVRLQAPIPAADRLELNGSKPVKSIEIPSGETLAMSLGHRANVKGLIHHSDQGVQYTSHRYREALDASGIECSMSRLANRWDNAVAESFFGTFKNELIYCRPWLTREDAGDAIVEYIEIFYNRIRRHSTIGYVGPVAFDEMDQVTRACAAYLRGRPFFWNKVRYYRVSSRTSGDPLAERSSFDSRVRQGSSRFSQRRSAARVPSPTTRLAARAGSGTKRNFALAVPA